MYEIKHSDVLPTPRRSKWPWALMAVGDYFEVDAANAQTDVLGPCFNTARAYKRRHPGWNYAGRRISETTVRFTRIA